MHLKFDKFHLVREINILLFVVLLFFVTGCFQNSAMVGPAMTLVSSGGNVYQAGFGFGANKLIEEETGMSTSEHVTKIVVDAKENQNIKKKNKELNKELYLLVNSHLKKTHKILKNNN